MAEFLRLHVPGGVANVAFGLSRRQRSCCQNSYYNSNNTSESAVVELKVRKFGNSLGVVLPKEVIHRLHTRDGEPLFLIEASQGGYLLTPYDPGFEEKMAKADDIISRYRNTLHVLAK